MENANENKLLDQYLRGEASEQEAAQVESWYLHEGTRLAVPPIEVDYAQRKLEILGKIREQPYRTKSLWRPWPTAIAAAALVLLAIGVAIRLGSPDDQQKPKFVIKNDISPGQSAATLVLSDGTKVPLSTLSALSPGKQAFSGRGSAAYKSEAGFLQYQPGKRQAEQHTLVTARAQSYRLQLPDGTLVWLNAASSLKYPTSFAAAKQRMVQLIGEAYFEVAKDSKRPFIVETRLQRIEVLGTHFNISSYATDGQTKTTLLEGSVKVFDKTTKQYSQLSEGQQQRSGPTGSQTTSVDPNLEAAWKDGDFTFQGDDFRAAMLKIARWYNVEIVIDTDPSQLMMPGGWISRSSKLSEVLRLMATTADLNFKIEERRVTISK